MKGRSVRFVSSVAVALAMVLSIVACGGSSTSPTTVSSIAVTGAAPAVGATSQLSAIATMSNGSTQDVTSLAAWQSMDVTEATVSATGVVTGVAPGSVTVQATYANVTGSEQITVSP